MLPSTFQDKLKKGRYEKTATARLNLARFIQDTVEELASDIKDRREVRGENDLHLSASKLLEMIKPFKKERKSIQSN